jgi:hypothetical protein
MPDLIHPLALRAVRAIHALKSPPPAGSRHYVSGFDDGLEAAIDAVKDAVPPTAVDVPRETSSHSCSDCGASPGKVHIGGCAVARCTVCGKQRITCAHVGTSEGWDDIHVPRETSGETRWDVIDRLPDEYAMPIHDSDYVDPVPTWQTWREALGHPYVEGHGYCKTCGPAITCALAAFYEAVIVSVVRELNKLGLLPPPAVDVPHETSTPDNGDTHD